MSFNILSFSVAGQIDPLSAYRESMPFGCPWTTPAPTSERLKQAEHQFQRAE